MFLDLKDVDKTAKLVARFIEREENKLLRRLAYIAEKALIQARDTNNPNTYTDQTGNLRSSISYVILNNGSIYKKSIAPSSVADSKASALFDRLKPTHSKGLVLIMVAGMNYAIYVASKRDVLDSAELVTKRLLDKLKKSYDKDK